MVRWHDESTESYGMKLALLVFLNLMAIILAVFWVKSDPGFEPKITLTLSIISLLAILSVRKIVIAKNAVLEKILGALKRFGLNLNRLGFP